MEGMLSFDMVKVEEGKIFIMSLIESEDPNKLNFLAASMDSIF